MLDLLQAYVRVEGRFDCVYSQGCGMFPSINAFGNKSQSLPRRLSNARQRPTSGSIFIPGTGPQYATPGDPSTAIVGYDTVDDAILDAATIFICPVIMYGRKKLG